MFEDSRGGIAWNACEGIPHWSKVVRPGVMMCYNPVRHGVVYVVVKRLFGLKRIRGVDDFRIGYYLRGLPVYAFRGHKNYTLLLTTYPELARLKYRDYVADAVQDHVKPVSWKAWWADTVDVAMRHNFKHLRPQHRFKLAGGRISENEKLKRHLSQEFRKRASDIAFGVVGFRSKYNKMLLPGVLACSDTRDTAYVILRRLFELHMTNVEDFATEKHIEGFPLYVFRGDTVPFLFSHPRIARADYEKRWKHQAWNPTWENYWNGITRNMLSRQCPRHFPQPRFRLLTNKKSAPGLEPDRKATC
jgi:hypothetical protein